MILNDPATGAMRRFGNVRRTLSYDFVDGAAALPAWLDLSLGTYALQPTAKRGEFSTAAQVGQ
jgi:hypothetical protein